jgi:hypothetical protein
MNHVDRLVILDLETMPDEGVLVRFSPKAQTSSVPPPIANGSFA